MLWMARRKDVIVDPKITEEDFLPEVIRQVKIQFEDELETQLRFYVKNKKKKRTTLKTIVLRRGWPAWRTRKMWRA